MGPNVQPSAGATPFGFTFDRRGRLMVSEAFGGALDASAVSSYRVAQNGDLTVISGSVPTTETAVCWIVITQDNRFAYTTNTGSGSISGYSIDQAGRLTLLDPDGRTGETGKGSAPIDMALTADGVFLYVLNSGLGKVAPSVWVPMAAWKPCRGSAGFLRAPTAWRRAETSCGADIAQPLQLRAAARTPRVVAGHGNL